MASYVDSNLTPGEAVQYRAKMHWLWFPKLTLLSLFFLPTKFFFVGILMISFNIGSALVGRWGYEFAVTNRRLIVKVGVLMRKTLELNLDKVESLAVDQGLLGRLFNYGTVVVSGSGGTKEPFKHIAKPLELRAAVNQAIEGMRSPAVRSVA